ncbi:MAG: LamG-like jellyroll fold domain-containing protein [Ignavibacteria bacterium]|nr:LamG-like jellyroll fold domain-containing protein [Ignavibacteria bacterium]
MKSLLRFSNLLLLYLVAFLSINILYAQEPIGGPYTADNNTMLLLHFDGNLNNESQFSANGVGHSNNPNGLTYLPSPLGAGMGQCLRLTNDAISDSSYVTVADTSYLDLTGSWTIEGWLNIFTFGQTSGDHRWVPRLVIKTGDEVFWRPNYFVEMWGSTRFFSTGYNVAGQDRWPQVNSPDNAMAPGAWYHMTFIRDTTRHILIQMIHNAQRQLIFFTTASYDPIFDDPPIITDQPVHIGFAGGGTDSWLDGFVDEIRISNNIRNFAVPPIITNVTELPNQLYTVTSYEVETNIFAFDPNGSITSAEIHYSTDSGNTWQTAAMTNIGGGDYSGSIPQQPLGKIIDYYVSATDNNGLSARYPPEAFGNLQFAIYKNNLMTLYLDFEEGSGTPIDKSIFHNPVTSPRPFVYSNDAAAGNYSILMQSDVGTNKDSSFLEVDSPFLTSLDFNVDFWFKADSIKQFVRLINRPIEYGNWFQNNYEIRFQDTPVLRGRYLIDTPTLDQYLELTLTTPIQTDTWYRVVLKRDSTMASLELFDANNQSLEVVDTTNLYNMTPIQPNVPLRIGNGGNVEGTRGFEGKIDEVKVFNNSEARNEPSGIEEDDQIPETFTLSQNFPNPFNPSTAIEYTVPRAQHVKIEVYDILGNKVKTLLDEEMYVGKHKVRWNGDNDFGRRVSSGVYFYKLTTIDVIISRKLVFLK